MKICDKTVRVDHVQNMTIDPPGVKSRWGIRAPNPQKTQNGKRSSF
jgi:hypothetical protein